MEVTHFNCVFCITWMPHCVREVNIIPVLEEKWSGNGWVIVLYMCCLMMYFQHNSFVKFIGFPILKGTQSKGWWLSCFVGINSYLGNTECVEFRVLLLSVCVCYEEACYLCIAGRGVQTPEPGSFIVHWLLKMWCEKAVRECDVALCRRLLLLGFWASSIICSL